MNKIWCKCILLFLSMYLFQNRIKSILILKSIISSPLCMHACHTLTKSCNFSYNSILIWQQIFKVKFGDFGGHVCRHIKYYAFQNTGTQMKTTVRLSKYSWSPLTSNYIKYLQTPFIIMITHFLAAILDAILNFSKRSKVPSRHPMKS